MTEMHKKITEQFLQTAVVIDEKAYLEPDKIPPKSPNIPTRYSKSSDNQNSNEKPKDYSSLDVETITNSFSEIGIICGVINQFDKDSSKKIIKKSDIVVLDWFLDDSDYTHTIKLLEELFKDSTSLRLIAIYTSENDLDKIADTISNELEIENSFADKEFIQHKFCRIVFYSKSEKSEDSLPKTLVDDFAKMTKGLLPDLALTSLTAVREGSRKVLAQFNSKLDPAYLTQRACISYADDSEEQFVDLIAEEIRSLMSDNVSKNSPAGKSAIDKWINDKINQKPDYFRFEDKTLDRCKVKSIANGGLNIDKENLNIKNLTKKKGGKYLSEIFSGSQGLNSQNCLDKKLAWIMNFRAVYEKKEPILWLGTVLKDNINNYLICITPRCDSVRLIAKTKFLFLPIIDPSNKSNEIRIVINDENNYLPKMINFKNFESYTFDPDLEKQSVIATATSDKDIIFKSTCSKRFIWIGELKYEYAQKISNHYASELSRPALDESEWLREFSHK